MGISPSKKKLLQKEVELRFACSTVQGRRPYNEDRFESRHPLIGRKSKDRGTSFFACYDGHGGEQTADYCANHLHSHIAQQPTFKGTTKDQAILQGFYTCDEAILSEQKATNQHAGTTAVVVLVDHTHLYSGNCGDTRAILSRGGVCVELSQDHKPSDEEEKQRIERGGAKVTVQEQQSVNPRTKAVTVHTQAYVELKDKGLAVSRALGNVSFKENGEKSAAEQIIVCTPYCKKIPRDVEKDEFLLLASDGLWNIISNQRAIDFVRQRLIEKSQKNAENGIISAEQEQEDLDDIVCSLTQYALDRKSNDNVTVVLVVFPAAFDAKKLKAVDAAAIAAAQAAAASTTGAGGGAGAGAGVGVASSSLGSEKKAAEGQSLSSKPVDKRSSVMTDLLSTKKTNGISSQQEEKTASPSKKSGLTDRTIAAATAPASAPSAAPPPVSSSSAALSPATVAFSNGASVEPSASASASANAVTPIVIDPAGKESAAVTPNVSVSKSEAAKESIPEPQTNANNPS